MAENLKKLTELFLNHIIWKMSEWIRQNVVRDLQYVDKTLKLWRTVCLKLSTSGWTTERLDGMVTLFHIQKPLLSQPQNRFSCVLTCLSSCYILLLRRKYNQLGVKIPFHNLRGNETEEERRQCLKTNRMTISQARSTTIPEEFIPEEEATKHEQP